MTNRVFTVSREFHLAGTDLALEFIFQKERERDLIFEYIYRRGRRTEVAFAANYSARIALYRCPMTNHSNRTTRCCNERRFDTLEIDTVKTPRFDGLVKSTHERRTRCDYRDNLSYDRSIALFFLRDDGRLMTGRF